MILPLLQIVKLQIQGKDISMSTFYDIYGISRQGFHQALNRKKLEANMMSQITKEVECYRFNKDRRAGSRSLFYNLDIKKRFGLGVNKFEHLMSLYKLTLRPLRLKVVTTQSSSQSWNYKNLINGLIVNTINKVVVGDLTYLSVGKNRFYMFCLTDVFSMRIVGYSVSTRMRKEEAIEALMKFVKLRGKTNLKNCIHHTDGGGQYFSKAYLQKLGKYIKISVAKSCIENGLAEQKNGFIKNHLLPTAKTENLFELKKEIAKMIKFYNADRKQEELGWRSPKEIERILEELTQNNMMIRLHDFIKNEPSQRIGF